jgi:hypothetical protein
MRLISSEDRIAIHGRTGTGKTTGAVWILSLADYLTRPWIILNQKRTKLIDAIPGAKKVQNSFRPDPNKPGIFIYHHVPVHDDDELEDLLHYVWSVGGIGVYIDEAYNIDPRSPGLIALYTQGREKQIPMITVSQRPSGICRFAISESEFFMLFHLSDKDDRKRIQSYVPLDLEEFMGSKIGDKHLLPKRHSIYYDVGDNSAEILTPVPPPAQILAIFESRMNPPRPDSENLSKYKISLI